MKLAGIKSCRVMPNVNLKEGTLDDLFELKKAYTAQTGEEASFDDVVSAAVSVLREESDFVLARRVKKCESSDEGSMHMSL